MQFHNCLEKILRSKLKVEILRTMYKLGDKKWTIRELANFRNKNHSVINYAIKDLQDMNLIYLEHHGKSNLITLNRKSILYELLEIFDDEKELLNELINDIKDLLRNKVDSCILFGSVARKEERPNSDVDLLIITKNKEQVKNLIYDKLKYFGHKYGNIIMPQIYTKKQFNKNLPFVKTIGKDYKVILGEDILK